MRRWLLLFTIAILIYVIHANGWAQEAGKSGASISGTLLMLDDRTPHVATVVQAVKPAPDEADEPTVIATTLSDENGDYRFTDLPAGPYQVRCYTLNGYVYYQERKVLQARSGRQLKAVDFRIAPFKKGTWRNYTTLDGLAYNAVNDIYRDRDGVMWFATESGGISRYDGKEFVNLTVKDGLVDGYVEVIYCDPDGVMWFGTMLGVSRYDGKEFVNLTEEDGLGQNWVPAIHRDPDGMMWFGTTSGGASRYDGKEFVNFTRADGLPSNVVHAIYGDPDAVLWFGTNDGVARYDGKEFISFTREDGLVNNQVMVIHGTPDGVLWFGTLGGVSRYDGKEFVNFTTEDGLANNDVTSIHGDSNGVIWFGTRGGVSRYDGVGFVNFVTNDGLANNLINTIYRDADGVMWFGTGEAGLSGRGGVSRYDGEGFINFTTKDGLANNRVMPILQAPDGVLWFGTRGGASRYDGKEFVNFTMEDGLALEDELASNHVWDIHRDPDGMLWFGIHWGGVSRYDGKEFTNFSIEDGLPRSSDGIVASIHHGADGIMWFGMWNGGVSLYDGKGFVNFTTEDGLANNHVYTIHRDPDGIMWFGTGGGGVSRYDGKEFVNSTTADGLAHNNVFAIYRDPDDVMWFGTDGGGASLYDGGAWSSLDTRDGLASNSVLSIHQDTEGFLWFGTAEGVVRYRRNTTPPKARIVSVTTDRTYRDLSGIPSFTPGVRITIEYKALDFKTVPEKQQYRCRVYETQDSLEPEEAYNPPTREITFNWIPNEPGSYTFEVQAIDRDLNYSEPANLKLIILPPPFYTRAGFIIGAILVAFLIPASAFATVLIRQRRQTFEPIQNPYIVGNPIRTKEMFFGRQADFEFVRAKLATGQSGLVIVFAGERRSGKTSILFQILEGALGEQFVPVLLDMQAMAVDNDAQFLEQIAAGIDEALVHAGCEPAQSDSWETDPVRTFGRFISYTMEQLGDRALLLMLDEYELIETKMDDGILRPDLITFFASLLEAHPRLSLIFTGSRHLEGRNRDYWSILIGKSLYRRISFLSESDALRLITEPVADRVVYPRGVPERIVRLTAGQPFYTQVMCQNMMDRLNEVERNRVRQEDVDAVAAELADNPLPQMIYFWDGLEQEQKGALSLLGEVLEDSNGYASAQTLLNFAQEQNLAIESELSDIERVLNDLFINDVLERERAGEGQYEYRFRADLFRLWVRQAHSAWE